MRRAPVPSRAVGEPVSAFAGRRDPETYAHFVDPFVALACAAGATSRIKLGTSIVLVPERPPALARQGSLRIPLGPPL